jgi:hypothetical protein
MKQPEKGLKHFCYDRFGTERSLWMDDGTVVLCSGTSLFRVYRGVLARESSVFKDLFSLPQPAGDPTYEGCPLVTLPDQPIDLYYLLAAIHDYRSFLNNPGSETFPVIAGILRLSTKYDIEHLRNRAIVVLEYHYPPTLKLWDQRDCWRDLGTDFEALNLARETNVPQLLPGVMYECCTEYMVEEIVDCFRGNPTIKELRIASPEDRRTCAAAAKELATRQYMACIAVTEPSQRIVKCATRQMCDHAKLNWLQKIESTKRASPKGLDSASEFSPLDPDIILGWDSLQAGLCGACFSKAKERYKQTRMALWRDLPTLFKLPSWQKLMVDVQSSKDEY